MEDWGRIGAVAYLLDTRHSTLDTARLGDAGVYLVMVGRGCSLICRYDVLAEIKLASASGR